jgi:hypothetical protein
MKKRVSSVIADWVEVHCTLNSTVWASYGELYESYLRSLSRVDDLTRKQFIAALRTVPGFKPQRRDGVYGAIYGCYGLQLDETAPLSQERSEPVFKMVGDAFEGRMFEVFDLLKLMRSNREVAEALMAAGCVKPRPQAVRYWLGGCRDWILGGFKLVRCRKEGETTLRYWQFEPRGAS